jgi:hypothetical protein
MAYSKAKFKSSGDRGSPFFKPFLIGNLPDRFFPTQNLLLVSGIDTTISVTSFIGIPNTMKILYKTSLLTES